MMEISVDYTKKTNLTSDDDSFVQVPIFVRCYLAALGFVAVILGMVGNTMIVLAFAVSERLQTKTNVFVVNLACADFVTSILTGIVSWSGIADIDPVHPWVNVSCAFVIGTIFCSVGCSTFSLAFIALNRLILITKTKETYEYIFRVQNVTLSICFTWLYPFSITIIPLLFDVGEFGFDHVSHTCAATSGHFYDVLLTCLLPLPMTVITYSYFCIFRFIRMHNKQVRNAHGETEERSQVRSSSKKTLSTKTAPNNSKQRNKRLRKEIHISKNLFYVIVTFLICMTPELIAETVDAGPIVILHTKMLVASNSFMNPILYGIKHPHFKLVFTCILKRRWGEVPEPSRLLRLFITRGKSSLSKSSVSTRNMQQLSTTH